MTIRIAITAMIVTAASGRRSRGLLYARRCRLPQGRRQPWQSELLITAWDQQEPRAAARCGVGQPHRRWLELRHEPEHAGRGRWRDLHRIGFRLLSGLTSGPIVPRHVTR